MPTVSFCLTSKVKSVEVDGWERLKVGQEEHTIVNFLDYEVLPVQLVDTSEIVNSSWSTFHQLDVFALVFCPTPDSAITKQNSTTHQRTSSSSFH
jgi:hypothetical protein